MLLSKIAMDVEAKHTKSLIAEWRYQDVPKIQFRFNFSTNSPKFS
jgi:hypothetical protein